MPDMGMAFSFLGALGRLGAAEVSWETWRRGRRFRFYIRGSGGAILPGRVGAPRQQPGSRSFGAKKVLSWRSLRSLRYFVPHSATSSASFFVAKPSKLQEKTISERMFFTTLHHPIS